MATTISGPSVTDDTGTVASPNEDGTNLNQSFFNSFYAAINAMWSGATQVFDGVLTLGGLGTHTVSASGAGHNTVRVQNASDGTNRAGTLEVGNSADADLGRIEAYAPSYTEAGVVKQNGVAVRAMGAGGLSLAAEHASGDVRLYGRDVLGATVNADGMSFDQAPDFAEAAGAGPDLSRGYPEALVKAWANISNSGSVTVNDHYNIDTGSTSRLAAGRVSIAFDTNLAITNYAVIVTPVTTGAQVVAAATSLAAGSVEIRTQSSTGTLTDYNFTVVIIGE